jgi:hypothetical protein
MSGKDKMRQRLSLLFTYIIQFGDLIFAIMKEFGTQKFGK